MSKLYRSVAVRIMLEEVVGYYEKLTNFQLDDKTANAGPGNYTKFARDLNTAGWYNGNKNGYDWCTTSYDWAIWQACGKDSEKAKKALRYNGELLGASCTWSVRYYKQAGAFRARGTYTPLPGDQIFFGASEENVQHTGMVEKVEGNTVYTMEGNVSNRGQAKSYSMSNTRIVGYGIPAYDGMEPPTEAKGLTAEEVKAIVAEMLKPIQTAFAGLQGSVDGLGKALAGRVTALEKAMDLVTSDIDEAVLAALEAEKAEKNDNDAGKWSAQARDFAVRNRLFIGAGTGKDGEPIYAWERPVTREELALVLFRLCQSNDDHV